MRSPGRWSGQRGAFICDACIDASRVVMDEEKRRRAMTPPGLVCQMCGALNAADAKQCVGCGDKPIKRPEPTTD